MNVSNCGGWKAGVRAICVWVGEEWDHYLAAKKESLKTLLGNG